MKVQVLSRDPDRGNPTPKRQGRWSGKPSLSWHAYVGRRPVKGRLVEAIGGYPFRTQVKRRKATSGGQVGVQRQPPIPVGALVVLATGWIGNLCSLPWEI